METPDSSQNRLVDYLILVGPGKGIEVEQITSPEEGPGSGRGKRKSHPNHHLHDWQNISTPVSSILCRFPITDHHDYSLAVDVSYFCQPEGCCVELLHPKSHVFMLTNTESNERTYGVCITFPHIFDPNINMDPSGIPTQCSDGMESICIREWGALSVCILSHHPFFSFFKKCLVTLSHFVENFGFSYLTWNALIWAQYETLTSNAFQSSCRTGLRFQMKEKGKGEKQQIVSEVVEWIDNLLLLPAPKEGSGGEDGHGEDGYGLEVELEVDPAIVICYPPKNRLPLLDLPLHRIFMRVGTHLVLDIYKMLLSEQKVSERERESGGGGGEERGCWMCRILTKAAMEGVGCVGYLLRQRCGKIR